MLDNKGFIKRNTFAVVNHIFFCSGGF
jgi:hypothetical protein